MFEHVGQSNYKEFFTVANRCLNDDGIFLLHSIGNNHKSQPGFDMWTHKYIFPNGCLPYFTEVTGAMDGLFVIEDWHNFGSDYAKTLEEWEKNFDSAWDNNLAPKYGDTFYKMWKLYLISVQILFKNRTFQLWQIVLSKNGVAGGYVR
jgi:cyclopropane-fatty-acyl-phospholipid synthase